MHVMRFITYSILPFVAEPSLRGSQKSADLPKIRALDENTILRSASDNTIFHDLITDPNNSQTINDAGLGDIANRAGNHQKDVGRAASIYLPESCFNRTEFNSVTPIDGLRIASQAKKNYEDGDCGVGESNEEVVSNLDNKIISSVDENFRDLGYFNVHPNCLQYRFLIFASLIHKVLLIDKDIENKILSTENAFDSAKNRSFKYCEQEADGLLKDYFSTENDTFDFIIKKTIDHCKRASEADCDEAFPLPTAPPTSPPIVSPTEAPAKPSEVPATQAPVRPPTKFPTLLPSVPPTQLSLLQERSQLLGTIDSNKYPHLYEIISNVYLFLDNIYKAKYADKVNFNKAEFLSVNPAHAFSLVYDAIKMCSEPEQRQCSAYNDKIGGQVKAIFGNDNCLQYHGLFIASIFYENFFAPRNNENNIISKLDSYSGNTELKNSKFCEIPYSSYADIFLSVKTFTFIKDRITEKCDQSAPEYCRNTDENQSSSSPASDDNDVPFPKTLFGKAAIISACAILIVATASSAKTLCPNIGQHEPRRPNLRRRARAATGGAAAGGAAAGGAAAGGAAAGGAAAGGAAAGGAAAGGAAAGGAAAGGAAAGGAAAGGAAAESTVVATIAVNTEALNYVTQQAASTLTNTTVSSFNDLANSGQIPTVQGQAAANLLTGTIEGTATVLGAIQTY